MEQSIASQASLHENSVVTKRFECKGGSLSGHTVMARIPQCSITRRASRHARQEGRLPLFPGLRAPEAGKRLGIASVHEKRGVRGDGRFYLFLASVCFVLQEGKGLPRRSFLSREG